MRGDSHESEPAIDLPLREQEPVVEAPPRHDTLHAAAAAPVRASRGGFAIGMLVLGLLGGFGGGFLVGQRLAVPSPPRAVEVPRPAPVDAARDKPIETTPPIQMALPPPVAPAQNVPEPPIVEAPVVVEEPKVVAPPSPPPAPKPKPKPAPPRVRNATVRFDSRPPGATVYLDDARLGVTPLTIEDVTPGTHQVRMEMLGHNTWRSSMTVKEGEQLVVGASLE